MKNDYGTRYKKSFVSFETVLLFFTGFIGLSNYANVIVNSLGVYLIEIFFIPIIIYYYYYKKISFNNVTKVTKFDLFQLLFITLSILLGIIHTGSGFNVITCIRPYVYLLLIIKFIRDNHIILDCTKLYVLALGCVIGDYVYINLYSKYMLSRGYQYINILAVSLITIIPLIEKKKILSIISLVFSISVSIISGYRINIAIVFVSVISCLIINLITTNKIKYNIIYITLITILYNVVIFVINHFEVVSGFISSVFHMNSQNTYRMFGRIQSLLNKDLSIGDQNRVNSFYLPFTRFSDNMFPVGPIGKNNLTHFGEYTDTPILFFYDVYGSLLSWLLLIFALVFFIRRALVIVKKARVKETTEYNILFVAILPIAFVLIVLNGSFLTFVNVSILFALAIGGYNCHS